MKKRSHIFIYVSAALILLATIMSSLFFRSFKQNENDTFSQPDHPDKIQLPGSDDKIYSSLDISFPTDIHQSPAISHETVKDLLSALEAPDVFYWYYNSTVLSSSNERTTNGIMKYNNGNYMIESYSGDINGKLEKTVIKEDGIITVQTYNSYQPTISEFVSDTTSAFVEAGVPDLETFISDTGSDFEYSLHDSEYGKILYAEFVTAKDSYSQEQRYYISLDFGIVIKAECYENDNLIYALNTITLYELETT